MSNEQDRRTIFRLQDDLRQMTAWGRGLEHELRLAKEDNQRLRDALYKVKRAWLTQNAMDIITIVDKAIYEDKP